MRFTWHAAEAKFFCQHMAQQCGALIDCETHPLYKHAMPLHLLKGEISVYSS